MLRLPEPLTAAPNDPPVHHVRVALDRRLRALLAHDQGARTGSDVEDVHQMRMSVRRMRAALQAARPLLDPDWSDELRAELGWLGHSLGAVRDLDVLLPRLRGLATDLCPDERDAAEQLLTPLREDYLAARRDMLTALSAPRYVTLLERLADAVRLPLPTRSATEHRPELIDLVRGEYRTLHKAVRRAGQNPPAHVLHTLRAKGKRLRYTGELAQPVLGKPVRRVVTATHKLQDVLGNHQDAWLAQQRIRELVAKLDGPASPSAVFVAGRMAEREHAHADRHRALWWGVWRQVKERVGELQR